ncbi:MAG: DUF1801 domain-containing protein [Candidatus Dojkabacteria bacterium]|nr:MAG: DUF1801 domain-containing protein [Candidatus Dojkabacteria bacterium]
MPKPSPEELQTLFESLKQILEVYVRHFNEVRIAPKRYELWSKGDFTISGRKRKELFFASVMLQKDYVGLYYMPVYTEPDMKKLFSPELLKLLKGKSCFHIKQLSPELEQEIQAALDAGLELYKTNKWV